MIELANLIKGLPEAEISGGLDRPIKGICCDSRRIGPDDLFVAIRGGEEQDRHQFVPDAVARGAKAVVVEEDISVGGITRIKVKSCRQALAHIASVYFGHPAKELSLIGITGTNGKTTTAFLVRQILAAAGRPCGYIGTLGIWAGADLEEGSNTTPEAPELHRSLRDILGAGKNAAVLEVSSHALALGRVDGLEFEVGVFTNLSRDHLDFHRSEEAYFAAKARLFERVVGTAVLNVDDPRGRQLAQKVDLPILTYGRSEGAQVRLVGWVSSEEGTDFNFATPKGQLIGRTRLTGAFNCHNLLAAVACGVSLGLEPAAIAAGVEDFDQVPGRFERIVEGQPYEVIVDYAHTPAGLETVLEAARPLAKNKLSCVFGCGGDRDRGKRPLMGAVADRLADRIYLTSDNPRSEEPATILAEIAAGVKGGSTLQTEADRYQAIHQALAAAEPGDVVVIAGKGHETVQVDAHGSTPFDDRQVARQILQHLAERQGGGE